MVTPLVRGTGLLATRAYLEKQFGPEAIAQMLGQMPASLAEPIRGIPIAHEWYPEESVLGLMDVAAAIHGDLVYDQMGAFAATYDLTFIHRFLLKFTSPMWLLDRGARLWSEYHNTGKWKIEKGPTPKSLRGELEEFGIVRATFCRALTAWIARAGELTGAKDIVVAHTRCRSTASRACVWEGHW